MTRVEWQETYANVWKWYYADEHVERLMRRNVAYGIKPIRVWRSIVQMHGATNFENVHPLQCGYFRRKDRTQRRPDMPRVSPFIFYVGHAAETLVKYARFGLYGVKTLRMRMRIERDPAARVYTVRAIAPVVDAESEALEMFELNASSRTAVEKARRQAKRLAADQLAVAEVRSE
jgi:hypothetical protein